jgi:hypothetical protein
MCTICKALQSHVCTTTKCFLKGVEGEHCFYISYETLWISQACFWINVIVLWTWASTWKTWWTFDTCELVLYYNIVDVHCRFIDSLLHSITFFSSSLPLGWGVPSTFDQVQKDGCVSGSWYRLKEETFFIDDLLYLIFLQYVK